MVTPLCVTRSFAAKANALKSFGDSSRHAAVGDTAPMKSWRFPVASSEALILLNTFASSEMALGKFLGDGYVALEARDPRDEAHRVSVALTAGTHSPVDLLSQRWQNRTDRKAILGYTIARAHATLPTSMTDRGFQLDMCSSSAPLPAN